MEVTTTTTTTNNNKKVKNKLVSSASSSENHLYPVCNYHLKLRINPIMSNLINTIHYYPSKDESITLTIPGYKSASSLAKNDNNNNKNVIVFELDNLLLKFRLFRYYHKDNILFTEDQISQNAYLKDVNEYLINVMKHDEIKSNPSLKGFEFYLHNPNDDANVFGVFTLMLNDVGAISLDYTKKVTTNNPKLTLLEEKKLIIKDYIHDISNVPIRSSSSSVSSMIESFFTKHTSNLNVKLPSSTDTLENDKYKDNNSPNKDPILFNHYSVGKIGNGYIVKECKFSVNTKISMIDYSSNENVIIQAIKIEINEKLWDSLQLSLKNYHNGK